MLVYFSEDWDVHWGYDLDFDPCPFEPLRFCDLFCSLARSWVSSRMSHKAFVFSTGPTDPARFGA